MKNLKMGKTSNKLTVLLKLLLILSISAFVQGRDDDGAYSSLARRGAVSFERMLEYQFSKNESKGTCFTTNVGETMMQFHESVLNEFGQMVRYASELGNKYIYEGDPWRDADIKAKRMVQSGIIDYT